MSFSLFHSHGFFYRVQHHEKIGKNRRNNQVHNMFKRIDKFSCLSPVFSAFLSRLHNRMASKRGLSVATRPGFARTVRFFTRCPVRQKFIVVYSKSPGISVLKNIILHLSQNFYFCELFSVGNNNIIWTIENQIDEIGRKWLSFAMI